MDSFPYIIYRIGSNTEAYNTATKTVQFTNPDASVVFNSVGNAMSSTGGGKAFVRNGLYPINSSILSKHFTGFIGESMEKTILRSTVNSNDNEIFRYWAGPSSTPLEAFTLRNMKLEIHNKNGNGLGDSKISWISSGTKSCTISEVWVKSFSKPSVPLIGFFLDTANNTNNNENTVIQNCIFEGPCSGQDMLGCGNLVDCDFSHNLFRNCDAQAIGVGASYRSIISNNRFFNTGHAIGYENLCEHNHISDNLLFETDGIKLSQEKSTWVNISRNNMCVNNQISYGGGGIQAGISIDDIISGNKFYRTERNGIYGSFCRAVIENNVFTDTNYELVEQPLLGNTTNNHRIGGIFCYNSNAPTSLIPANEFNIFTNNTFIKSGINFTAGTQQRSGNTGGIVLDTKYTNSYLNLNKGNIGTDLLTNFGSIALIPN